MYKPVHSLHSSLRTKLLSDVFIYILGPSKDRLNHRIAISKLREHVQVKDYLHLDNDIFVDVSNSSCVTSSLATSTPGLDIWHFSLNWIVCNFAVSVVLGCAGARLCWSICSNLFKSGVKLRINHIWKCNTEYCNDGAAAAARAQVSILNSPPAQPSPAQPSSVLVSFLLLSIRTINTVWKKKYKILVF